MDPLGEGGAGSVVRAWDNNLQRMVALKRLKENEGSIDAIMREAQILASLHHPNIVTVYDFGVDEEGAFVVMELVDGKMVHHWVTQKPLSLSLFREVADQTLLGLSVAHGKGLIHRDIKPHNIMIQFDGKKVLVKLLDFGLAEGGQIAEKKEEEEGTVMGSVHTISPEQLVGESATESTDLYSMGCVFYYALTGHYPYEGKTMEEVIEGHLHGTPTPLNAVRPAIPPLLAQVIGRYLSRKPEERPASAEKAREQMLVITKSPVFHEKDFGLKQFSAQAIKSSTSSVTQVASSSIGKVPASSVAPKSQVKRMTGKIPVAEVEAAEAQKKKTMIIVAAIFTSLIFVGVVTWLLLRSDSKSSKKGAKPVVATAPAVPVAPVPKPTVPVVETKPAPTPPPKPAVVLPVAPPKKEEPKIEAPKPAPKPVPPPAPVPIVKKEEPKPVQEVKPTPAPAPVPAPVESFKPVAIHPTNLSALKANLGRPVVFEVKVVGSGESPRPQFYYMFQGTASSTPIFFIKRDTDESAKSRMDVYRGRVIRVTGVVVENGSSYAIEVRDADIDLIE